MRSRPETIRDEIMLQSYGFRPAARDSERMATYARTEGELRDGMPEEFERECIYLVGKGLVEPEPNPLAQGHVRYKITAAGVDFMEGQGHKV